jgi:hypothetical protein
MNLTRIFSEKKAWTLAKEVSPDFRVVIVYDDRDGLGGAKRLLNRLLSQLDGRFKLDCVLWHSDVLASRQWIETTVSSGNGAELIIVSTSCTKDLSVLTWGDRLEKGSGGGLFRCVCIGRINDQVCVEGKHSPSQSS